MLRVGLGLKGVRTSFGELYAGLPTIRTRDRQQTPAPYAAIG